MRGSDNGSRRFSFADRILPLRPAELFCGCSPSTDSTPDLSLDVTLLLDRIRRGDSDARDLLIRRLYEELRELARVQRYRLGAGDTLNTTALVHETYEKLSIYDAEWSDRRHFFRVSARVMRQVVIDDIRRRKSGKRGGGNQPVSFDESWMLPEGQAVEVEALDEALEELAKIDERQSEIVDLRYFVGLTIEETADVLDLSPATVKRLWTAARAWLYDAVRLQ